MKPTRGQQKEKCDQLVDGKTVKVTDQDYKRLKEFHKRRHFCGAVRVLESCDGEAKRCFTSDTYDARVDPVGEYRALMKEDEEANMRRRRREKEANAAEKKVRENIKYCERLEEEEVDVKKQDTGNTMLGDEVYDI